MLPNSRFFASLLAAEPSSPAIVEPSPTNSTSSASTGPPDSITTSYSDLLRHIVSVQRALESHVELGDRVGILVDKTVVYPAAFLGVWAAGGVAVPICTSHPVPEMLYTLGDSGSRVLLVSRHFERRGEELKRELGTLEVVHVSDLLSPETQRIGKEDKDLLQSGQQQQPKTVDTNLLESSSSESNASASTPTRSQYQLDEQTFNEDTNALIIYTSGTTGKPKGAVHTHRSTTAQLASLKEAWHYDVKDRLLHVLPLHHIHGIVNALLTPLYSGSCVEFAEEKFNPSRVWQRLLSSSSSSSNEGDNPFSSRRDPPITLFMAVPTIYTKLLGAVPQGGGPDSTKLRDVRLCVSGSAALPTSVKQAWKSATGHVLLERYGMTEIGMGLSCGMAEEDRLDASVGWPLPGVSAKLVDQETGEEVTGYDVPGEIWIAGEVLFKEYHCRPDQTAKEIAVDRDGKRWFKTGDVAIRSHQHKGAYFIQGRSSVDIIKSGGYKISALDVEREMLRHLATRISEVAVVGVEDREWGQRVAAVITPTTNAGLDASGRHTGGEEDGDSRVGGEVTLEEVREVMKRQVAGYKVPTLLKVMKGGIPRNAMGKVNKKELVKVFHDNADGSKL